MVGMGGGGSRLWRFTWLPAADLPLGDSNEGRILARLAIQARNFWEMGPVESAGGAP